MNKKNTDAGADTTEGEWSSSSLPRMMTVTEAADLLGLSILDVWKLVSGGVLPAVRAGNAKTIWIHPRDALMIVEATAS
jgi:excisionase family DNA binding protein